MKSSYEILEHLIYKQHTKKDNLCISYRKIAPYDSLIFCYVSMGIRFCLHIMRAVKKGCDETGDFMI